MIIAGQYERGEVLGAGAMGEVYRGTDSKNGQPVAIKRLKSGLLARQPHLLERFRREGEALARLNHPNIVRMLAAAQEGDDHYIVMEYVGGGDLADLIKAEGQLPIERVLAIGLDLADALTRAHRLGIIHRDLKPANVLIAEDGTPRLTDFGVAHVQGESTLTGSGVMVGTYAYISPESAMGLPLDERADIWAFGVMLYEIAAGQRPFQGEAPAAMLHAIMSDIHPSLTAHRPDAPDDLTDLIDRMLVKDREGRIPSVRMVGVELEAMLKGRSSGLTLLPVVEPSPLFEDTTSTATQVVRHNLPHQVTPFVGREAEIHDLRDIIDSDCRLITLIGPGGAGKTRLALEVASGYVTASAVYDHGIGFVELAPLDTTAALVVEIGRVAGVQFGSGDPKQELLDYLREKRMLLVLDNFEHLLGGASIADEILQAAPGVQILATSRARLNLSVECIYELGGMRTPESIADVDVDDCEAVEMFVTYARRAQPNFELTDEDRPAVARITQLVDGMPLGIELAAAWARMLSADEIAEELSENLDLLETTAQDVPERQRSLQAVFDYSWNLLSAAERESFLRLSVFRGGFDRKAAKAVAGASLIVLRGLVDKSLLRREPDGRYFVHQMLRQYAERRLEQEDPAEAQRIREEHCKTYVSFVEALGPRLEGENVGPYLQAIDVEFDNIRVAVEFASESNQAQYLADIILPLRFYFEGRSRSIEAVQLFDVMAGGAQGVDERTYALARTAQAGFMQRSGHKTESLPVLEEAYAIMERLDDEYGMGVALIWTAYALMFAGRLEEAREKNERAVTYLEAADARVSAQEAHANLGYLLYLMGDYERARHHMLKSGYLEDPNDISRAYGFNNLGEVEMAEGNYEEALALFRKSNDLFTQINSLRGMAFTLNNIGAVLRAKGEIMAALDALKPALSLNREIGDRSGEANVLANMGDLSALQEGDTPTTREYFQQALDLRRAINDKLGVADSLASLGTLALEGGRFSDASTLLTEGLSIAEQTGSRSLLGLVRCKLGELALAVNQYEAARAHLQAGLTIARDINDRALLAYATATMGIIALELDDLDEARTHLQESLLLFREMDAVKDVAFVLAWLGTVAAHAGHLDEARRFHRQGLQIARETTLEAAALPNIIQMGRFHAEHGDPKRAVELLTMAAGHPLTVASQQQRIGQYFEMLRETLPTDDYDKARKRGQAQRLWDVVRDVMA